MSYVDADKFKTQEEVAMETRCIAWNIRQHFTFKKRKKTWANSCQIMFWVGKNQFVICSQTEIFSFRNNEAKRDESIYILFWIVYLASEQKVILYGKTFFCSPYTANPSLPSHMLESPSNFPFIINEITLMDSHVL